MKATGIVRRIDELGRIVIPREIRKNLRIRQGESMEIYTTGEGEVVFRKYSTLSGYPDLMEDVVQALANAGRCSVLCIDRERVVAAAGPQKGQWLGRPLEPEWLQAIENRRAGNVGEWFISPLLDEGELLGALLFCRADTRQEALMQNLQQFSAGLITRYMQV